MHVVYTMCFDFFRMQESKNKFACDSDLEGFFWLELCIFLWLHLHVKYGRYFS